VKIFKIMIIIYTIINELLKKYTYMIAAI